MPHTNITEQVQKIYTKQSPHEAIYLEPGQTVPFEAMRVEAVALDEDYELWQAPADNAPKKKKSRAKKQA